MQMIELRFDTMTAALAAHGTRRGVVGVVLSALLGLGGHERAAQAARATCRREGASCTRASQCCIGTCQTGRGAGARRNRCGCPLGQGVCNGTCQDIAWDRDNCGACGNQCTGNDVCTDGVCTGCDDYEENCWIDLAGREWGGGSANSVPERLLCESDADCQASLNCDLGRCYCLVDSFQNYGTEPFYTPSPKECGVLVDYPATAR
jgi:hypothetical protein